jgi:hypothetical protein
MCSVSKVSRHPLGARAGQEDLAAIPYFVRFQEAARMILQRSTDFEEWPRPQGNRRKRRHFA